MKNETFFVQRGILISTMGEEKYWDFCKRYPHSVIWKAFDTSLQAIQVPTWKRRLYKLVKRLRQRAECIQFWLEAT